MSDGTAEQTVDLTAIEGRVWVFGDNVNTDVMMPGALALVPGGGQRRPELWCFHATRPGWAELVRPGDLIVGGRNFGCGSGRNVPALLRKLGIQAVVADSFARTFFRNAINMALPVLECEGCRDAAREGERIRVDVESGLLHNLSRGSCLRGTPLPPESPPAQILRAGGFEPFLSALLAARGLAEGQAGGDQS
jgi:3-isopropylmalate/(R)-2-methylmalate dehydratase small subunit